MQKHCADTVQCEHCGKTVKRTSSNQRWCPECAPEMWRKRALEYRRERSGQTLSRERLCEMCKRPYIPAVGNQKYCPDCREEARRINKNAYKRRAARKYRAEERPGTRSKNWLEALLNGARYCMCCGKQLEEGQKGYCPRCKDILSIQHKRPLPEEYCEGCIYFRTLSGGSFGGEYRGYRACHHLFDTGERRDQSGGIHTCGSRTERSAKT